MDLFEETETEQKMALELQKKQEEEMLQKLNEKRKKNLFGVDEKDAVHLRSVQLIRKSIT